MWLLAAIFVLTTTVLVFIAGFRSALAWREDAVATLIEVDGSRISKERHLATLGRLASILKPGGTAVAAIAILVGLFQFLEDERQKEALEERAQFAKSLENITSNEKGANLGSIVLVGQLGEDDSVRHWAMVEALTDYVRFFYARQASDIRINGHNRDEHYADPDGPASRDDQLQFYKQKASPNVLPIPAQVALTTLGTREMKFEDPAILRNVPRARMYLHPPSTEQCTTSEKIQQKLRQMREGHDDNTSIAQLVLEIGDMCTPSPSHGSDRPWLKLSQSTLSQADLRSMNFEGADFSDSDLSFSSFAFGQFAKSVFRRSSLVGVDMWNANLRDADLRWVDARGTLFGQANLRSAVLSGANLSRANLYKADLEGALLIAANLEGVNTMAGANMRGIVAYRANFTGAYFAGDGENPVCMNRSYLGEAHFEGAHMSGVDMRGAILAYAHFSDATELAGANLRGATLDYAHLKGVNFQGVKLDGASFSNAEVDGANFEGVDLSHVRLSREQIEKAKTDSKTVFEVATVDARPHKPDGSDNNTLQSFASDGETPCTAGAHR